MRLIHLRTCQAILRFLVLSMPGFWNVAQNNSGVSQVQGGLSGLVEAR